MLLHRYSREDEVVFGVTRACRRSAFPDADEMVGLFINTLPLRVSVDPELSLDEFLKDVRALQIGLREHEHTPLVKVQGWSDIPRGRRSSTRSWSTRTTPSTRCCGRSTLAALGACVLVSRADQLPAHRSSPTATTRCSCASRTTAGTSDDRGRSNAGPPRDDSHGDAEARRAEAPRAAAAHQRGAGRPRIDRSRGDLSRRPLPARALRGAVRGSHPSGWRSSARKRR